MITCIPLQGLLDVNCYLYADEASSHAFLIDPGAQGEALLSWLRAQGITVEKILLTHGHFDHIGGLDVLWEREGIPVWIHEKGPAYLADPMLNLSGRFRRPLRFSGAQVFRDGDTLSLEANPDYALQVIHTPGHTQDSVLFYDEKRGFAFSGDTIFQGSRGNDTFPGGNGAQLLESIRRRVLTLPAETVLYPGHGEATTVGAEKSPIILFSSHRRAWMKAPAPPARINQLRVSLPVRNFPPGRRDESAAAARVHRARFTPLPARRQRGRRQNAHGPRSCPG